MLPSDVPSFFRELSFGISFAFLRFSLSDLPRFVLLDGGSTPPAHAETIEKKLAVDMSFTRLVVVAVLEHDKY
jgi:hypothetical protein